MSRPKLRHLNNHQMKRKAAEIRARYASQKPTNPRTLEARIARHKTTLESANPFRKWLQANHMHFRELSHERGSRYFFIDHILAKREAIVRFSDHMPKFGKKYLASVDGRTHTLKEAQDLVLGFQNT